MNSNRINLFIKFKGTKLLMDLKFSNKNSLKIFVRRNKDIINDMQIMLLNPKNMGRETKILSRAFLELVKIVRYRIIKDTKKTADQLAAQYALEELGASY